MSAGCKVCDDRAMRIAVDEYLDRKEKYSFISRVMTARGFPVSAEIVSKHRGHRHEYESTQPSRVQKRDAATLIRDKQLAALEALEAEDDKGTVLLAKDLQPALSNILKAQAVIDKREAVAKKQNTADLLVSLLAALRGEGRPVAMLDDGNTIEGQSVEVD